MKARHAISLLAVAFTCLGAIASSLALQNRSSGYPLAWEFLTIGPLLILQLLSAVLSWRPQVAPPLTRRVVLALVCSSISLFVGSITAVVLLVGGLAVAPEGRSFVLALFAVLVVLPLSSYLNAYACWQALFPASNEAQ